MNATEKAMQHVCDAWKPAKVIDLQAARERREQRRKGDWLRTYTKPMPDPPAAA